ncbi:MAG: ribosome small subunit-dependent GTPase A [bacterium]|nr:ribosome small subunit-dependent GTPase A [bacterium]
MDLIKLGWNSTFATHHEPWRAKGLIPARVTREDKYTYTILSEHGEQSATLMGKFRYHAKSRGDYPAVGDWVSVRALPDENKALIAAVLPRRGTIMRRAVLAGGPAYGEGRAEEQVLAANVDTTFLVSGLDDNWNLRRIERYLAVAWDSGTNPVIVLNKADTCIDTEAVHAEVEGVAMGMPVICVSALTGVGVTKLRDCLQGVNPTGVFLGSSGVGKSTLINSLLGGKAMLTGAVRDGDSRGRHTTTHRELHQLPEGGVLIDTPGLREIQTWNDEEGTSRAFADINELTARCRFRNCRHDGEPGCGILAALEDGTLDPGRYKNYLRLNHENRKLAQRRGAQSRFKR